MTLVNGYATLADLQHYLTAVGLSFSTDGNNDAVMEEIIEAASRFFDGETRRTFYARAAETRYFNVPEADSGDPRALKLDDDLLSIDASGLVNGDTTVLTSAEYKLLPLNLTQKRAIRLKDSSSFYWSADSSGDVVGIISVKGSWGYAAAAPTNVKQAVVEISAGAYKRRFGENMSAVTTITAAGMTITPQDVTIFAQRTIAQYQRKL